MVVREVSRSSMSLHKRNLHLHLPLYNITLTSAFFSVLHVVRAAASFRAMVALQEWYALEPGPRLCPIRDTALHYTAPSAGMEQLGKRSCKRSLSM